MDESDGLVVINEVTNIPSILKKFDYFKIIVDIVYCIAKLYKLITSNKWLVKIDLNISNNLNQ